MRLLVEIRVHLVLECLILWSELEADKVGLASIQDGDLEITHAFNLSSETTLDLQLCLDLLVDVHLHGIHQRIELNGLSLCWSSSSLYLLCCSRRWLCRTEACEDITRLLLAKHHALSGSTWLQWRRASIIVHTGVPLCRCNVGCGGSRGHGFLQG